MTAAPIPLNAGDHSTGGVAFGNTETLSIQAGSDLTVGVSYSFSTTVSTAVTVDVPNGPEYAGKVFQITWYAGLMDYRLVNLDTTWINGVWSVDKDILVGWNRGRATGVPYYVLEEK